MIQKKSLLEALFSPGTTKAVGDRAEDWALAHLQAQGLRLVQRHYRTPGRGGGEIDLIMRDAQGTLVFVEVRARRSDRQGGALASVTPTKQKRIVYAAHHYLRQWVSPPPCRFDVLAVHEEDGQVQAQWVQGAFDAS